MGTSLANEKIKEKFGDLLKIDGGIDSSTTAVEDGAGNDSALKLSINTVEIAGTLNFTAPPTTDNAESTALLIDGSDNVVTRELGTAAFKQEFPRIIARATGSQAVTAGANQDVKFTGIDNATSTASFIQDDGGNYSFTGTGNTTVICGSAGIYRMDLSIYLTSIGTPNAVATISLMKNGSPLAIAVRSKSSNTKSMVSFFWSEKLAANDEISVNVAMDGDPATITAGSCLEVHQIAKL